MTRNILPCILAALLLPTSLVATTYILPAWEESATTSEFVGIVECITAGGIVARYRVVDSWKGAPVGTELNISQHVDSCGPLFPSSLVGERSLVFAEEYVSYDTGSLGLGRGSPLWWRKIPTDLSCFSLIPLKETMGRYLSAVMGSRSGEIDQFKADVMRFLSLNTEGQELRLMLATARQNLHLPNPTEPSDRGDEGDIKLYEKLNTATTVDQLFELIIQLASELKPPAVPKTDKERKAQNHKGTLLDILNGGGRARCKDLMEKADRSMLPWDEKEVNQTISAIRWNLSPYKGRSPPLDTPEAKHEPTSTDIAKAKALVSQPWDHQTSAAFELLCRHSPASVVPFLRAWKPSKKEHSPPFGYYLGSVFGHLCTSERLVHLEGLLSVDEPWIKVSAAVYLCFDDAEQGKEALRKLLSLEGDPGAWAAIVLASRGEKTAMARALEVMTSPDDQGVYSMHRHVLQLRLRVLLSNIAHASGVPQPPGLPKEHYDWSERMDVHQQWHESLVKWWEENQNKINLQDPWAETLAAQKVD